LSEPRSIKVADQAAVLGEVIGKADGAKLATQVVTALKDCGGELILDFVQVKAISSSAAQMFVYVLSAELGESCFSSIVVRNANEYVRERLQVAFNSSAVRNSRKAM